MTIKNVAAWVATLLLAGSAQANMIAGWDVSLYDSGFLFVSADGTFPSQLSANFSDLDTDNTGTTGQIPGLGAGSEPFGTWYLNSAFGGTGNDVPDFSTDPFVPTFGSLTSNDGAPTTWAGGTFNSGLISLTNDGQPQAIDNRMVFSDSEPIVSTFGATLESISAVGSDWMLMLAGILEPGAGAGSLGFEVSFDGGATFTTDGISIQIADGAALATPTVDLSGVDTKYTVFLGGVGEEEILVRLTAGTGTAIDNISIHATIPEPGTVLLVLAGLTGLATFGRRRSA